MINNTDNPKDNPANNPWALHPAKGWKTASNTLDTLFYRELTKAEQRRRNENESVLESARIIRNNMLHRMTILTTHEQQSFNMQSGDPELLLVTHICQVLALPEKHISALHGHHTMT